MAAARAAGPPSRLLLAPITELTYATADDSDHETWSLNLGTLPTR